MSELFDEYYTVLKSKRGRLTAARNVVYGGEVLKVAGSLVLREDTEVSVLKVAGSLKHMGNIKAKEVKVSGRLEVKGFLKADVVKVAGSLFVGGDLIVNNVVKVAGSAKVGETVVGGDVKVAGSLKTSRIKCSVFKSSGSIRAEDLLAKEVYIRLHSSVCRISNIRADVIEVKLREEEEWSLGEFVVRALSSFLECFDVDLEREGRLYSEKIAGRDVYLENTTCRLVEGDCVEIGPECDIDKVVYKVDVSVHPSSKVRKIKKMTSGQSSGA
ncbi:MAG: hypothetical protein DRJ52_02895 [Thermoprotei archaeon]|nr:MAG: hypothetical protein DRJ52_02895 [Thermoprotei archaeon]RLF00848.1 MAG: hypothetical protein DRJ63_01100 [Thermoprotei archaeon]